jgi:hypothetical protein
MNGENPLKIINIVQNQQVTSMAHSVRIVLLSKIGLNVESKRSKRGINEGGANKA